MQRLQQVETGRIQRDRFGHIQNQNPRWCVLRLKQDLEFADGRKEEGAEQSVSGNALATRVAECTRSVVVL